MGNQIYTKGTFIIVDVKDGYIVVNKEKQFEEGHTHILNFKTAKYLIDMVMYSRIPYHLSPYLLVSLQRLSADESYQAKIGELLKNKQEHKQRYVR